MKDKLLVCVLLIGAAANVFTSFMGAIILIKGMVVPIIGWFFLLGGACAAYMLLRAIKEEGDL